MQGDSYQRKIASRITTVGLVWPGIPSKVQTCLNLPGGLLSEVWLVRLVSSWETKKISAKKISSAFSVELSSDTDYEYLCRNEKKYNYIWKCKESVEITLCGVVYFDISDFYPKTFKLALGVSIKYLTLARIYFSWQWFYSVLLYRRCVDLILQIWIKQGITKRMKKRKHCLGLHMITVK